MRVCKECGLTASIETDLKLFVKSKLSKYGHMNLCKACMCIKRREKYNQKEYTREYRKRNKEVLRPKMVKWAADWKAANRDKRSHAEAKRRAKKRGSMSILSNKEKKAIEIMYKVAKTMSKLGSKVYHVDHIIPLAKGGAHTIDNLQIIDSKLNLSKGSNTDIGRVHKNQIRKDIL